MDPEEEEPVALPWYVSTIRTEPNTKKQTSIVCDEARKPGLFLQRLTSISLKTATSSATKKLCGQKYHPSAAVPLLWSLKQSRQIVMGPKDYCTPPSPTKKALHILELKWTRHVRFSRTRELLQPSRIWKTILPCCGWWSSLWLLNLVNQQLTQCRQQEFTNLRLTDPARFIIPPCFMVNHQLWVN